MVNLVDRSLTRSQDYDSFPSNATSPGDNLPFSLPKGQASPMASPYCGLPRIHFLSTKPYRKSIRSAPSPRLSTQQEAPSRKRCLRCGELYEDSDNSPTACSFHGHTTGTCIRSVLFRCRGLTSVLVGCRGERVVLVEREREQAEHGERQLEEAMELLRRVRRERAAWLRLRVWRKPPYPIEIKKDVVFRCVRLLVRGRSKSRETQLGAENGHAHPQLTYPTTGPSLHSSSSSPAKSPASSPGTTRIPLAAPPRVPRPLPPSLRLPRPPPSSSWRSKCPLLAAAAPRPLLRRGPAAAAAGAGGAPGVRPQADEAGAHRFQDPPFPGLPLASLLRSVQASSEALELML
ncbi:hypothetical protein GW17_00010792, partial [Ensete ventricosum]